MSDAEVESTFRQVRWHETDGEPVCPACGGLDAYDCRRPSGASRYRCRACKTDFSLTSGTLFASHKLPLRMYLAAIALFVNEVKGKSMLALGRELGVSYKTALVLAHKLREAISLEFKGREVGGEGKIVEIDGAYFGVYVKPTNLVQNRRDLRRKENYSPNRRVVVVARERGGLSTVGVFKTEPKSAPWLRKIIRSGTLVQADEVPSWNPLQNKYAMQRINHKRDGYSLDGACTNLAESFFSRLRRAEVGQHHHISGPYTLRYAREAAWREDMRRKSNGEQVHTILSLALRSKPSVDFSGYWQRGLERKQNAARRKFATGEIST